ncbi:hypothetical protein IAC76_06985 [Spirochaetes bacterium]|uniref:Uncharacterized protein n=1 Tax=Candidatus Scatousia excrementipullorum TaxID=2840936 RepID=A0A9D9DNG1_9BACT|nr:hypothetical protein [Candidatus Scatousia excrementipullorum]
MGMSASQARLLSLTARMTDNENSAQDITYSKIRLANQTEELNNEYLDALDATKLTVLTGFKDSEEIYTDISYGLMTGYNTVAAGKQYVVTDVKGRVLVTAEYAAAFEAGNGDLNKFLAELGYSQATIDVSANSEASDTDKALAKQKVHEAWDQYLTSVGLHYGDEEHGLEFGYTSFGNEPYNGYPTYTLIDLNTGAQSTKALVYEGSTQEQREFYDYAVALTEAYYGTSDSVNTLKTAADSENAGYIKYLSNIFQKMLSAGYYTEEEPTETIKDNAWFEKQLKDGKLLLEYYSTTEKKFVSTSIDSDTAIQEVEDERELSLIEQKYNNQLDDLEAKDNQFDLELKKLDTEHNALQTEYDAVKSVIEKNVEKTFNIFS